MQDVPENELVQSSLSEAPVVKKRAESSLMRPEHKSASPTWAMILNRLWRRFDYRKLALFILSLFLFTLAITLMKEGARSLIPLVRDNFRVSNPANSLGFGWLFAYVIMSGSPVAASALTFLDAQVLTMLGTFTMITGSRLGASFIVLFIGFIYVLRGRNRSTSLSMGLLSLTVTGINHLAALPIGLLLIRRGALDDFRFSSGVVINAITGYVFDPIATLAQTYLPQWGLFVAGLIIIIFSFSLFDKCLPQMTLKESHVGRLSRLVYRPSVMFLLGAGVTLISMSVSVSLSILVPLSNRGFVRRENVIPYIMGAGVTTFIDTLFASVVLNNPAAVTVVLVQMVSIMVVSVFILMTIYRFYEHALLRLVGWMTMRNRHLALFMLAIFTVPVLLMLF